MNQAEFTELHRLLTALKLCGLYIFLAKHINPNCVLGGGIYKVNSFYDVK